MIASICKKSWGIRPQISIIFLPSGLKVPLFLPAPDRKGCIFGLARQKNRIRNTTINKATPEHKFSTLAFGSGGDLHVLWTVHLFTSLVVILFYNAIIRPRRDWASYLFANTKSIWLHKLKVAQNTVLRICLESLITTPINFNVPHHLRIRVYLHLNSEGSSKQKQWYFEVPPFL